MFTNALDSRWRPVHPFAVVLTAEITFEDRPGGTLYRAVVRHGDAETRARHEEIGFAPGWGTVIEQLAALAESQEAHS